MRRFLPLLLALVLAGCFTAGKRGDAALVIHDLGLPAAAGARPAQLSLALEVRAPLWFDSLGINYRLLYVEPTRLREYARVRWAGPPANMIQQRLTRELGLISAGQGRAACVLRIDIVEFSQVFPAPDVSHALLQGRVQWLDRQRARLAERDVSIQLAAATADSQGGVAALVGAVEQLGGQLRTWEAELLSAGQLAVCRP